jgi:hypothetical protein
MQGAAIGERFAQRLHHAAMHGPAMQDHDGDFAVAVGFDM